MSKKKIIVLVIVAVLIIAAVITFFILKPDYWNAAQLEDALNRGIDVKGKTAWVEIDSIHEDALLGLYKYNFWAGQHLNLLTNYNYNVRSGKVLHIIIKDVATIGDRHFIEFYTK